MTSSQQPQDVHRCPGESGSRPVPPTPGGDGPPVSAAGVDVEASALPGLERRLDIAVDGLIGAYDLSASVGVQVHVTQVLARVGVRHIAVESGSLFDPSAYEAVSTVLTEDPDRVARVAQMVRPGWRRPDAVLRFPQVSVWIAEPTRPGPPADPGMNGGQ
jgi:hypothetical protein